MRPKSRATVMPQPSERSGSAASCEAITVVCVPRAMAIPAWRKRQVSSAMLSGSTA